MPITQNLLLQMPDTKLELPPFPVALVPGYSYKEPKTLELRCYDRYFNDATITDATGDGLFHVKSKKIGKSWSLRRSLYDASGQHVLDFRHYDLDIKNRWTIEDPSSKKLASIEHAHFFTKEHSNVDMTVFKGEEGGDDVVLQMRQKDRSAVTTFVGLQGSTVAEIAMRERNEMLFNQAQGRDSSVWEIRVAPTMDLSLIAVMALCRAEMAHVWKQ